MTNEIDRAGEMLALVYARFPQLRDEDETNVMLMLLELRMAFEGMMDDE